MKAMILAAGFGTRLWPLTEDRTKPAVPFLGKALVAYSLEYVHRFGVRDVVVNLHHCGESVRAALGDGTAFGCRVHYSIEDEILGTGGALDRARDRLDDDDFIVVNGKIVTDIELGAAIAEHRERKAVATLVLLPNVNRERFTIVERDAEGLITRFAGLPDPENPLPEHPLMFTGIQILSPRIFNYIPRGRFSHTTTEAFPAAIAAGDPIVGHVGAGSWKEMSTLERYLDESIAAAHVVGRRNVVGQGSRIDDAANVDESVLWNDVTVEGGATVRRSILGDGVHVPSGARIEDSVVVRAEIVRKIERGRLFGDLLVAPIRPVLD
jgi:NDP-sugar pyrophosphorylase family protein